MKIGIMGAACRIGDAHPSGGAPGLISMIVDSIYLVF